MKSMKNRIRKIQTKLVHLPSHTPERIITPSTTAKEAAEIYMELVRRPLTDDEIKAREEAKRIWAASTPEEKEAAGEAYAQRLREA